MCIRDRDIVKEVKGNTVISTDENGNETKLVNSITEEGKIILNVEDSDGNKVGLTDYTADVYKRQSLSSFLYAANTSNKKVWFFCAINLPT